MIDSPSMIFVFFAFLSYLARLTIGVYLSVMMLSLNAPVLLLVYMAGIFIFLEMDKVLGDFVMKFYAIGLLNKELNITVNSKKVIYLNRIIKFQSVFFLISVSIIFALWGICGQYLLWSYLILAPIISLIAVIVTRFKSRKL